MINNCVLRHRNTNQGKTTVARRENVKSQGVYQDEDYRFFMSLHQQLNEMLLVRKVKAKIHMIFYKELCAREFAIHTWRENNSELCSYGRRKEKVLDYY